MTVSGYFEIDERVWSDAQQYLDLHPDWSCDRLVQTSIALFLMQNGGSSQSTSRAYLDGLFGAVDV